MIKRPVKKKLNVICNDQGSVMVEGAFAVPIFVILFLGIIAWNYFFFTDVVIEYATLASARCDAMPNPPSGVKYCGGYEAAGAAWSLGLVSNGVFQQASGSGSGSFPESCITATRPNPLAFLLFLPVPSTNSLAFCRPKLS